MNNLKIYKSKILKHVTGLQSFQKGWNTWRPIFKTYLKEKNGENIFKLGENLSNIFMSYKPPSKRDQSAVSSGGTAWECINVWYLNLIFWNTSITASRSNKTFIPKCFRDALTVSYGSISTNTESDISIFSIPESNKLNSPKTKDLNTYILSKMDYVNFVNLQCKTNWNDNAQVPMLWDIIYSSNEKLNNISVGINGVSPHSFNSFSYAFSTVPTVDKSKFKKDSVAVLRVRNLSGRNFWGHPTEAGVANCINELASNSFASEFKGGVISHLNNSIKSDSNYFERFLNLDFLLE